MRRRQAILLSSPGWRFIVSIFSRCDTRTLTLVFVFSLLRANMPFTTITLEETIVLQGRFFTLFDFPQILSNPHDQNTRKDLDRILLRLASFIYQTTSLNFESYHRHIYHGMSYSFASPYQLLSIAIICS